MSKGMLMNTKFNLSFKETSYLLILWLMRHIFNSEYHNFKKTKYNIDTHEDYVLAEQISTMAGRCDHKFPKVDKYKIESFSDISDLMNEVVRYEYSRKRYWLTSNDQCAIKGWRNHIKFGNDHGFWWELHFAILIEFRGN